MSVITCNEKQKRQVELDFHVQARTEKKILMICSDKVPTFIGEN